MGENTTRILIVDDHPFVREGLRQLLSGQAEFSVVAEASGTADAQAAANTHRPDVVVVDLALGHDDGTQLIRLLRLGVNGYVMKNAAGTDFLGALRKVARGQRHLSPAMGERLLAKAARGRNSGTDEDPVSGLTERELEVFRMLGAGVSTREIAEQLTLSMKTVDAHRRHMREKLNLRSTNELIRYATQWVSDHGETA